MYISEITKYVYFIFSYLVHPLPLILDMVVVVQAERCCQAASPPEQNEKNVYSLIFNSWQ